MSTTADTTDNNPPSTTNNIDTVEISKQVNEVIAWFNANPTMVQEFHDKLKAILDSIRVTTPPVDPPANTLIGPDGIKQIYPIKQDAKAKPFYINLDNPDGNPKVFATTYGSDIVKFEKAALNGKMKYVRNKGHKQTYH